MRTAVACRALSLSSLIAVSACRGSGTTPTYKPPPEAVPTATRIAVSGPPSAFFNTTVRFTATVGMSDGSERDVTTGAVWSANPSYWVSAEANGSVKVGSKSGSASVTAYYGGLYGTTTLEIVPSVLHSTLNSGEQMVSGEPSFAGKYHANWAFDDFTSAVETSTSHVTVTFQGIQCGSPRIGYFNTRLHRSAGDLPNLSNYTDGLVAGTDSEDGVAPGVCPGGRDGRLFTYSGPVRTRPINIGERLWLTVFASVQDLDYAAPDQWLFRHGPGGNGYAVAYRDTGNVIRQTRDLAFKVECGPTGC